jgi:hypothetical protein
MRAMPSVFLLYMPPRNQQAMLEAIDEVDQFFSSASAGLNVILAKSEEVAYEIISYRIARTGGLGRATYLTTPSASQRSPSFGLNQSNNSDRPSGAKTG